MDEKFKTEGIRYLGSKRKIIPYIIQAIQGKPIKKVCDLFTGSTRVAQALKKSGYDVVANDLASYSSVFARCYLSDPKLLSIVKPILNTLNNETIPVSGWLTSNYAGGSISHDLKGKPTVAYPIKFWQVHNTTKADTIRDQIDIIPQASGVIKDILLTSLILALDKVDNTLGLQQAFLKNVWSTRSNNQLKLELPDVPEGNGVYEVFQEDANKLVRELTDVDLYYLDPPYTPNVPYYSYYNIWESIVRNDKPEVFGVANKRTDIRDAKNKSDYANKKRAMKAMADLIENIKAKFILLSYSNDGILTYDEIMSLLSKRGTTVVKEIDYKKNVMCDIGRFDKAGERVSEKQGDKNIEYLFLCTVGG